MSADVLAPVFNSLITIVISVILGLIGLAVNKYVKNADARAAIQGALKNAGGVVLAYGQARGDQFLQNTAIKNAALAAGAAYVAQQVPEALAHFGQTDADIATKVQAVAATALSLATPIPDGTVSVTGTGSVVIPPAPAPLVSRKV
jgi:N-acetylglucosamine kinase-like BadF-type ATPase